MVHIIDGPNKDFAMRLIDLRRKKEFTQEKLANAIKVDKRSISMYENGRTFPREDTIYRLAEELEVDPDWLATGIDKEMSSYYGQQSADTDANVQNLVKKVEYIYIEKWDELRSGSRLISSCTYSASPERSSQCSDLNKFITVIKTSFQRYGAVEFPGTLPSIPTYPAGTIIVFDTGHQMIENIPSGTDVIYRVKSEKLNPGLRKVFKEPGAKPILISLNPSCCIQPISATNANVEIIGIVKSVIINN